MKDTDIGERRANSSKDIDIGERRADGSKDIDIAERRADGSFTSTGIKAFRKVEDKFYHPHQDLYHMGSNNQSPKL